VSENRKPREIFETKKEGLGSQKNGKITQKQKTSQLFYTSDRPIITVIK
jgi:hypothetical protein